MKIALTAKGWDIPAWTENLNKLLPDAEVRLSDDLGDLSEIDYALAWKGDTAFLKDLPNLKAIFSLGAGVEFLTQEPNLPNVPIVRVIGDDLTARMCEYVVLNVLMHHRHSLRSLGLQANRDWNQRPDAAAEDFRVGMLGIGVLGLAAARKLQSLGYRVSGWGRSSKQVEGLATYHGAEGLDEMLAKTDILVSLLPHTPQTEGILNLDLFKKLAKDGPLGGPVIINAGRGKLQVEADIVTAIREGILAGASLDVFEQEPLPEDSPLWDLPNVIITPHIAAVSAPYATTKGIVEQILRNEAGDPMVGIVDRGVGY
ncbi:glyoxylate/hydroxypyruvate reductase A [uncultured Cohaesibacter sp.]|uniref:2-hydroxyacid dehydrogenase n=1 Tax=uncultured Cohaesibacter sp. TaxID=1002546 RepID=UPI0029C797C3|nr:glyoxylate/hydroxypyruvate reductase A [uncultured Cohaesibacter sp.]